MFALFNHRVQFFLAGVQKGGTTALDGLLRDHPDVRMARVKEPHFFDDETIDWSRPDYDAYHAMFDLDGVDESAAVGEATPISTYWPQALERIAAYNPRAKIIVCLRHPSFRAHSHWRMETARAAEDLPFGDAIRDRGRARMAGGAHRVFSYVERGLYFWQVVRVRSLFTRTLFVRTDRLWREPDATLAEICAFLGVASYPKRIGQSRYHVPIETGRLGGMDRADRLYLDRLFAGDIRLTGSMTGLDLTDWLDPAYGEPMPVGPTPTWAED